MSLHEFIAIATLVVAVVLFISEAIPLALTALFIPVVLAVTGTLESPDQALAGFGNPAVIALAAIFVMGAGLKESGVATLMARGLEHVGGRSEARLVIAIMVSVAVLSALMSNAATVAVFLPAVAALARRADVPTSRLMMPLSFAAIVGGILTIIGTTPNIILAEDMRSRSGTALDAMVFLKVGAPVVAASIAYMVLVGRKLLPAVSSAERLGGVSLPGDVANAYGIAENLYRMRVSERSPLVGQKLKDANMGGVWDLKLVLVSRAKGSRRRPIHPHPDLVFQAGDELYVEGETRSAWRLSEDMKVQFGMTDASAVAQLFEQGILLAEAAIPPRSEVIGKTLRDLEFRKVFDLSALAILRRDKVISSDLADIPLELGDGFLVSGSAAKVRALARDHRFIVLTQDTSGEDVSRAPLAIALLFAALIPPLIGWLPLAVSGLASVLLMFATGCVSKSAIRESMDFRILFLVAGTIPLGMALEQHGVAGETANWILTLGGPFGTAGVLSALFVISAVLSTTSNNGAAAVILSPVAWQVSQSSGLALEKSLLAVAFGTSCAYMLPFAHQCNLMVMGPGGYRTKDFAKVGLGMSIVMAVMTIVMLVLI